MYKKWYKKCVKLWLVVTVALLLVLSTSCYKTIRYEPTSDVLIVNKGDIVPFRGVLIGEQRWLKIYERLFECEQ